MGFMKKYLSKLFFKQWSIGIAEYSIADIIRTKKTDLSFEWLKTDSIMQSFADPFVFISQNGETNIFAEQFTTGELDGKITLIAHNNTQGFSSPKTILQTESHFSYPHIYEENDKTFVLIENAFNNTLASYEYNPKSKELHTKKQICDLPLIDATILKKNDKYWLFGTLLGEGKFSQLHIYHADNFYGPYTAHTANPVKNNLNGSRPAGAFIEVDGEIYRPAQNCSMYYGESITINKVISLSETEFEEVEYMKISSNKNAEFNFGMHTINAAGKYIVVDGQKGHFQPLLQLIRVIKKKLGLNKSKFYSVAYCLQDIYFEEYALALSL
jgi:hypothetical protein